MSELFANKAQTTLNGTITNSQTSITVTSATGFPASGNFRIILLAEGGNTDEIMTVTAVSGTTFTVTRASEAVAGVQSASAHNNGTSIAHVLTAEAVKNISVTGARIYHNTSFTPSDSSSTYVLPYNSETYDTNGFHDTVTNNSRITIPSGLGGKYLISASTTISGTTNISNADITMTLRLNGTNLIVLKGSVRSEHLNIFNSQFPTVIGFTTLDVVTSDYLEIQWKTNIGNTPPNIGSTDSTFYNWFEVIKLGS